MNPRCPNCKKQRFTGIKTAKKAARRIERGYAYRCELCPYWTVSSNAGAIRRPKSEPYNRKKQK